MADERKRIIEFDAADSMPSDGNIAVDSPQQGTKKLTAIKMKEYVVGNTPLPTTAQSVTGAIAEVDGKAYKNQTCTQEEYNELPDTKNSDNTARFIPDGQPTSGLALWAKVGTAGLHTTAPDCSGAINELKSSLDDCFQSDDSTVTGLATDTTILSFGAGSYKIALPSASEYIPIRYGVLNVFVARDYVFCLVLDSANNMYKRFGNNSTLSWYTNWTIA